MRNANAVLTLVAATVLVFMVGIVAAMILDQYAKVHQAYSTYQEYAEQDRRDASEEIAQACVGMSGGGFTECVVDKLEAHYRDQATNQDLQAQQDMAFWALCAFLSSCATVFITAVGVYYVRKTLEASYLAVYEAAEGSKAAALGARAALDSVKQGRDANRIARDSVNATKQIGRDQSRAYMLASKCMLAKQRGSYKINIFLVNNGQTPAIDVKVRASGRVVPLVEQNSLIFDRGEEFRELGTWASGAANHTEYDSEDIKSGGWADALLLNPVVVVSGTIRYTDIFGHVFETDFGFKASGFGDAGTTMTPQSASLRSFERIGDLETGIWTDDQGRDG